MSEARWVQKMQPWINRQAWHHLRPGIDIEDLIAEGNLATVLACRSFKAGKGKALTSWLMGKITAANRTEKQFRSPLEECRRPPVEPVDFDQRREMASIEVGLNDIPARQRAIIVGTFLEGLELGDCEPGVTRSVASRLRTRGLNNLRKAALRVAL